jgi:hypothetical protein
MSNPKWKGLSSHQRARDLSCGAGTPKAPSRPCLPAVEQLGDRILLSADVAVIGDNPGESPPPPPIDQILVGLLKGQLEMATHELAALKIAGAANPKLVHKLTEGLLKVDDVLYKYGESLITDRIGDIKLGDIKQDVFLKLESEFNKIDGVIAILPKDAQAQLKIVVTNLEKKANEILIGLQKVGPLGDLSNKDQQSFLKVTDAFADLDAGLLKLQESILERKAGKGQQEFLVVKFNDVLVSSVKEATDGDLEDDLLGVAAGMDRILIGLLQPPETDDVIG